MGTTVTYSNAEKLMAVVEAWARPRLAQLPSPYSYLAPALTPLVQNVLNRIPDETIPQTVNAIIDDAVKQGSVTLWKINLDKNDLMDLQHLIRLNLPCQQDERKQGYKVVSE